MQGWEETWYQITALPCSPPWLSILKISSGVSPVWGDAPQNSLPEAPYEPPCCSGSDVRVFVSERGGGWMAPWVLHFWLGKWKPYQGGLAVLQQSCPAPSPTFGPCRLEGTLSPCHRLQCGESRKVHLTMAVDGWKSWELAISAGQRDPNSAAPSGGPQKLASFPCLFFWLQTSLTSYFQHYRWKMSL